MQKTILLLIANFFVLTSLFAIQIEHITDITNGEMLYDYDRYAGAITGFEDRVIMNNLYSIEEFEILEDGTLNRIAYFEAYQSSPYLHIYQDRLYIYNSRFDINHIPHYFFRVFDLTQKPMIEIAEFETPEVLTGYVPSVNFQGSYMYISFMGWEQYHITAKYNLETFTFEGFVNPALGGSWVMIYGATLLNMYTSPNGYYMLRFFEFVNDQMIPLNDFVLPVHTSDGVSGFYLQNGSNFVFSLYDGAVVVDFSDVLNPIIVADIRHNNQQESIYATSFTGEYIVMSTGGWKLWVYQRNEDGQYTLKGTKDSGNDIAGQRSLYVKDNLIFNQAGIDFRVFDLSTPDIDEVYRYGKSNMAIAYNYTSQQDEFYYLWLDWVTFSYDIYSILDNELVVSIPNEDQNDNTWQLIVYKFLIEDDKLYVLLSREMGLVCRFEIYDIIGNQANRVNSVVLPHRSMNFIKTANRVFFETYTQDNVDVYSIEDNLLFSLGSLPVGLESRNSRHADDFIITHSGNNVHFRESIDHDNIFFSASFPYGIGEVSYIDSRYLLVMPYTEADQKTAHIYEYSLVDNSITLFHTFPESLMNFNVNSFDGIITRNAYHEATSEYYTILNGELVRIGELGGNDNRMVWKTYFYPARGKMVQVAWSGIWVYDFEYEEYVSDSDIAVPAGVAALRGNYPNPFNPSTTISFSLGSAERVVIDVYNVRGQRVRSLVDGVYGAGEHSVVWNGCDDLGRGVGSGVYFYRMISGDYSGVKKMLLLK